MTSAIFQKHYGELGVTNSQVSILFVLSKTQGKTQKELSDILVLEKSSIHRNLKRLEQKQLITRAEFPNFKISDQGKKLVELIIPRWKNAMKEIRAILGTENEIILTEINHSLLKSRT